MKQHIYLTLISIASERMQRSKDPIHDHAHVSRVVKYTQDLAKKLSVSETNLHALLIAAWWHDVSRTLTKQPSFIWMPLIDDIVSSVMLLYTIVRKKLWSKDSLLAARIVFCKSTAAGTFLRKLLLNPSQQILVDILKDADALDLLHTDRTKHLQELVNISLLYAYGYKLQAWWFFSCQQIKFKTEAAKEQFVTLLKEFLAWISEEMTIAWHKHTFGEEWVSNMMNDIKRLIAQFEVQH